MNTLNVSELVKNSYPSFSIQLVASLLTLHDIFIDEFFEVTFEVVLGYSISWSAASVNIHHIANGKGGDSVSIAKSATEEAKSKAP